MREQESRQCEMLACTRPRGNGRLCWTHYNRTRRGHLPINAPIQEKRRGDEVCRYPECGQPETRGMWCDYHYWQAKRGRTMTAYFRKTGTPTEWGECALDTCHDRARPEALVCTRHRALASKYGMEQAALVAFWGDGACRACGAAYGPRTSIDHDHACCPVGNSRKCGHCNRGLLCHGCNVALGIVNDDPERLRALLAYLG